MCLQVLYSDGQGRCKVSETLTVGFWRTAAQVQANQNAPFDLAMLQRNSRPIIIYIVCQLSHGDCRFARGDVEIAVQSPRLTARPRPQLTGPPSGSRPSRAVCRNAAPQLHKDSCTGEPTACLATPTADKLCSCTCRRWLWFRWPVVRAIYSRCQKIR